MVYITKIEKDKKIAEGLCPVCASELGIKPVNEMFQKMGISKEELDGMMHTTDTLTREKTVFTLDYAQAGLGNRSCGPDVLPKYRLAPNAVRCAYTVCHVTHSDDISLNSYSTDILPALEEKATAVISYGTEEYRDPSDEDVRKKAGFTVG